jgi:hypothetical protein
MSATPHEAADALRAGALILGYAYQAEKLRQDNG